MRGYVSNFSILIGIDRIRVDILPSYVGATSCMVRNVSSSAYTPGCHVLCGIVVPS